jgi:SAM-dependent methyltransferase
MTGSPQMLSSPTCRVCGSTRSRYLCTTHNEHSETARLDNFRCRDCGSVFIGNAVSDEELARAYASLDEAAYYQETAEASARKFECAARDVLSIAAPSAALLDVGGGNGAFCRALAALGFDNLSIHEIPGADLPELAGRVRAVYRDADYRSVPGGAFDVVTMMDVMEHVPHVDATMTAARRMLRPGGLLYVHTPVVTRLDCLMHLLQKLPLLARLGQAWQRGRTSIFHLQNYTPRALTGLVQRHGFTVVRLDTVNELSWPIARYVRVYLCDKLGLPRALAPLTAALVGPVLRSRLNANKAVLVARRL